MSPRLAKLSPLFVLAVATPRAQARFEVATVKPSPQGATARDSHFSVRGDRFEMTAATVGDVLDMLNGFQLFRVSGGPNWVRTDRFDILAKADRPIAGSDLKAVVMALLAERFQLQAHDETRDTPGFTIRAPGASGTLKPAGSDEKYSLGMKDGGVVFTAASMGSLSNYLSQMWSAPVEDQTKLEGGYDFTLATSRVERHSGEKWGDWVRSALEDLGFRVEARKIPAEITVIDHCERPNEN